MIYFSVKVQPMKPLIIISLLALVSCRPETLNSPESQVSTTKPISNYKSYNSSEFEYLGFVHNQMMDYVATIPNFLTSSDEDGFNYLETFTKPNLNLNFQTYLEFSAMYNEDITLCATQDLSTSRLFEQGGLPKEFSAPVQELFDIFRNASINASPEGLIQQVTKLEMRIDQLYKIEYNASTYEGNSAALIMGACAIAKASTDYWFQAHQFETHPWYPYLMSASGRNSIPPIILPSGSGSTAAFRSWLGRVITDIGAFFGRIPDEITTEYDDDHLSGVGGSWSLSEGLTNAGAASRAHVSW